MGDLGTGSPCALTSQCYDPLVGTRECRTTWPDGYCTSTCALTGHSCGALLFGPGYCTSAGQCLLKCASAGTGQSDCRMGYLCEFAESNGSGNNQGVCIPRCTAPGYVCHSGTCDTTSGYCR